jgi:hypothetical protein
VKKRIVNHLLLYLLACLLIPLAGCKKEETEEETPATTTDTTMSTSTSTETSIAPDMGTGSSMGTDMGTPSSTMGTDMTTSSPMGSDATKPPAGDGHPHPQQSSGGERYPEFPWPPPEASATAIVPQLFLANSKGSTTLKDVDRRLTGALERNGYFESSYYAVPQGFALVTKMEQIKANGQSSDKTVRWIVNRQPLQKFSLQEYLRALFGAAPGRYRIIVFVVTPHPFSQSDAVVTPKEGSRWLREGLNQLPTPIGHLSFDDLNCTALIYEFVRTSDVADPELQRPSQLSGRDHLEMSGIWRRLAK